MSASGSILPNPKMYFVDNTGKPLGAGFLYTYRSLDKTQFKQTFKDPGLLIPNTDPIRLDLNGTTGPVFWTADEPYYIVVTDLFGMQIWDMDNYGPAIAGGGGGGNITTAISLDNLVKNGSFYRNEYNPDSSTPSISPVPNFLKLAPGAHAGLSGDAANTAGSPSPDICFIKNGTGANDTLSFLKFPLGGNDFNTDVTPVYYLNYVSSAATGEDYKYVQFPITGGAQNLSGQIIQGKLWYKWTSGPATLNFFWRQFYGSGPSASPETRSSPLALNLITDNAWHSIPIVLPVPNASGKNLGECGNDGLFMQIQFPLNQACSIAFTKPAIYLGAATPNEDFATNDEVESITNDFRTGDVRTSLNDFTPFGWVPMNDGTIGSKTSGATARANRDTFPLYNLLWNNVVDMWAAVTGGRGASAVADFSANKPMTLTRALGRVIGGAGAGAGLTPRALGQFVGTENTILTTSNLPDHKHTASDTGGNFVIDQLPGIVTIGLGGTNSTTSDRTGGIVGPPFSQPFSNMQPSAFMNMYIKL
jgi:hypothetical protein